jgi:spermidine/putrescine transport system substrate-binding protein
MLLSRPLARRREAATQIHSASAERRAISPAHQHEVDSYPAESEPVGAKSNRRNRCPVASTRNGVERGLFAPLPEEELPLEDMYPQVRLDQFTTADGKRYAITESSATTRSASTGTRSTSRTWGRSAPIRSTRAGLPSTIYYLPVIGMAALATGRKTADLTADDLPAIKDVLLQWKANARLVGEVTASQTALATGEADILVGGGEWVTAVLAAENPALDFSIPEEGGILWSQSLAMFTDSENQDLALNFIQYVMSPEGQARLATSSCYWGMPANAKAALTDEQKVVLRFDEQPEFLERAQLYPAPDEALDKKMQDLWTDMLQAQ